MYLCSTYLMTRHRSVEHVDTDDAVADHEEDGPDEHEPASRHPGPPDSCCEPEDVDGDTNSQDRVHQASLEHTSLLTPFYDS